MSTTAVPSLPSGRFVGLIPLLLGAAALLGLWALTDPAPVSWWLILAGVGLGILGLGLLGVWTARVWAVVRSGKDSLSPSLAGLLAAVPVFNLFVWHQVAWGLNKRVLR